MKRYWYRLCPTCEQGRLFVNRRADCQSLYLLCEECYCAFRGPAEASDGKNCQEGMDIQGEDASHEDIVRYGWSEYSFQEVS